MKLSNFDKTTNAMGTAVAYGTQELGKVSEVVDKYAAQAINTGIKTIEDLKESSMFNIGVKTAGAGLVLGGIGNLTGSSTLTSVGETLVDTGVTIMGVTALATAYSNRNVTAEEVKAYIATEKLVAKEDSDI